MVADHIYDSLEIVCTKLGIQGQCVYRNTIFFTTVFNKTILIGFGFWDIVLPRIIAGDDYCFFRTKKGRLFEGGDYFKLLTGSRALNILFYYLIKSKSYHTI